MKSTFFSLLSALCLFLATTFASPLKAPTPSAHVTVKATAVGGGGVKKWKLPIVLSDQYYYKLSRELPSFSPIR
jgi:hypothetical protein